MSKHILYVGEFNLPDKSAAANRVVSNAKIFSEIGFDTVFLGASYDDNFFDGIRKLEEHENMYEFAHPSSLKQWVTHIFSTGNLKFLVEKYEPEAIILYNMPIVTLLSVRKAFKDKNIKIFYDCTEWTKYTSGSLPKKIFKYIDEWFVRNTLEYFVDGIIAISDRMKNKYKKCKNLAKIPPLVDIDDCIWHQPPDESDDVFEFCFAGVPDGNKESPDKIIEAFCKVNDENTRLRIVGMTKEEFVKAYPSLHEQADCERIVFMGKVSHKDAVKYIIDCDCYIFIRVSDARNNAGFPTKFAEAYTLSCPVITTDISDLANYFKNENCGQLLDTISVEAIADAIKKETAKGKMIKPRSIRNNFDYRSYIDVCREFLD